MHDLTDMLASMSALEWAMLIYTIGAMLMMARLIYISARELPENPPPILVWIGMVVGWPVTLFAAVCDVIANGPGEDGKA